MFVSTRGLAPMFSNRSTKNRLKVLRCQCPLGLIPHFYRLWKLFKHDRSYWVCQCPLGLIPHFYEPAMKIELFIPRIKCQCPLGLIPHFYVLKISTIYHFTLLVSMPSRAYTSFLRYPFKNLGFMRFPEPVFAGIYQNILTTAVFRAC